MSNGLIIWLTGLSGAGKSTLATALAAEYSFYGVEILDGDVIRKHLCPDLGFTAKDRENNLERVGYIARMLAKHNVTVIVATISPYEALRERQRRLAKEQNIPFCCVYIDCDLETVIERDVKGLYKRALAGEIDNFTGISAPFEPPENPDIVINTKDSSLDESLVFLLTRLAPYFII